EAIQEVAVQTSNFAAEFGQVGGGLFNATMKSGTNQFHGSLYDYNVNAAYNAAQPYTGLRNRARRTTTGDAVAGPFGFPSFITEQIGLFSFGISSNIAKHRWFLLLLRLFPFRITGPAISARCLPDRAISW